MNSKKLTVKRFVVIVVLTALACLGLFPVMLTTLVLTGSGIAALLAEFIYAAVVVLLCIVPWRLKERLLT